MPSRRPSASCWAIWCRIRPFRRSKVRKAPFNILSDGTYAANQWHTDVTFVDAYPLASILRAIKLPSKGGDTVWANTAAAYEHLPEPLRELADKLWALHTIRLRLCRRASRRHGRAAEAPRQRLRLHGLRERAPTRPRPSGDRRADAAAGQISRKKIIGLNKDDSARLIAIFQDHIITRLENTARWHWALGDVAIWDNRRHAALRHRRLYRGARTAPRHHRRRRGRSGSTASPASRAARTCAIPNFKVAAE